MNASRPQVANRCCGGRVVSALEGGYRIQGGPVSAFSRSVAAHVRALARPHTQAWSPADAQVLDTAPPPPFYVDAHARECKNARDFRGTC